MADGEAENDKRVYHTLFGDFTQINPGVYKSASVNPQSLIVPAAVSSTGEEQAIKLKPGTLIVTPDEGKNYNRARHGGNEAERTALLNNVSLVSTFMAISKDFYRIIDPAERVKPEAQPILFTQMSFIVANIKENTSVRSNLEGGGIINVSNKNMPTFWLALLASPP